jgi:hypothetical protein
MKTKIAFFATLLAFASIIPVLGQSVPEETPNSNWNMNEMRDLAGPPTFEATESGIHMKVWIMTQDEHRKLMEANESKTQQKDEYGNSQQKDNAAGMDKATKNAMLAGTHHIKLEATDEVTGNVIENATAKVKVVSPSGKSSWVDLREMTDHFGAGLTLKEKGDYRFIVDIDHAGTTSSKEFTYAVR